MDTLRPQDIKATKQLIRDKMPRTYESIHDKAKGEMGQRAFELVTRGLRGEPNCFYAMEAGHVVGTPFDENVSNEIAALMVQFKSACVVMWARSSHAGGQ